MADLCRINTLFMIMQAGSGHIGSSFSSTDIITWLWTEDLHDPNGDSDDADVYFSSKGHDAPALYSLLIAIEKLGFDLLPKLRQLNGLPGPSRRQHAVHRHQHRLARHGHLEGLRHGARQSLHRPQRPHRA